MDHLIHDHEKRQRRWGGGIKDFGLNVNDIEIRASTNGKTYLIEKLFFITVSTLIAVLTRSS